MITDENAEIVSTHNYQPYGNELTQANYETNTHKFTGHERDAETGLDYMLARHCDSTFGRFLSVDPGLDYDQMDPMSWNLYGYVRGNPVKATDPSGESYLVFDGKKQTLTLYSHDGIKMGNWKAANNVSNNNSKGKWEDGRVAFAYHKTHKNDSKTSAFGSHGSLNFGDYINNKKTIAFTETNGNERTTMAVHSGRGDNPNAKTNGCIRTTDKAMEIILDVQSNGDPLEYIKVENNKAQKKETSNPRKDPFVEPDAHENTVANNINTILDTLNNLVTLM
jgi:RHS repeat-associated protein